MCFLFITYLAAGCAMIISTQNAQKKLIGQFTGQLASSSKLTCPDTAVPIIGPMALMRADIMVTHAMMFSAIFELTLSEGAEYLPTMRFAAFPTMNDISSITTIHTNGRHISVSTAVLPLSPFTLALFMNAMMYDVMQAIMLP